MDAPNSPPSFDHLARDPHQFGNRSSPIGPSSQPQRIGEPEFAVYLKAKWRPQTRPQPRERTAFNHRKPRTVLSGRSRTGREYCCRTPREAGFITRESVSLHFLELALRLAWLRVLLFDVAPPLAEPPRGSVKPVPVPQSFRCGVRPEQGLAAKRSKSA